MQFSPNAYIFRFNTEEWAEYIPKSDSLDLCMITGVLLNYDGSALSNAQIELTTFGWIENDIIHIGRPSFYPPALLSAVPSIVYSDISGIFSFQALRNTLLRIEIPKAGYLAVVKVPDKPFESFDLLEKV